MLTGFLPLKFFVEKRRKSKRAKCGEQSMWLPATVLGMAK